MDTATYRLLGTEINVVHFTAKHTTMFPIELVVGALSPFRLNTLFIINLLSRCHYISSMFYQVLTRKPNTSCSYFNLQFSAIAETGKPLSVFL